MRLLAPLLALTALAAADPGTDLRMTLGSYPGLRTVGYESDSGATSPDYAIHDRSGGSLEMLAAHAFRSDGDAGGFLQIGMAIRGFTGTDEAGWKHNVSALGILVGGGLAWRPSPAFNLEIGPTVTLGSASAREEMGGMKADSDRGDYAAADLRIGAWWTLRQRFQIGTVAGVAAQTATVHQPAHPGFAGTDVDATYRGRGGFAALGIGLRL